MHHFKIEFTVILWYYLLGNYTASICKTTYLRVHLTVETTQFTVRLSVSKTFHSKIHSNFTPKLVNSRVVILRQFMTAYHQSVFYHNLEVIFQSMGKDSLQLYTSSSTQPSGQSGIRVTGKWGGCGVPAPWWGVVEGGPRGTDPQYSRGTHHQNDSGCQ